MEATFSPKNSTATGTALADDHLVTVCDACLMACCWQGEFYCDNSRSAGTTEKTVAELRQLKLESEHYWRHQEHGTCA